MSGDRSLIDGKHYEEVTKELYLNGKDIFFQQKILRRYYQIVNGVLVFLRIMMRETENHVEKRMTVWRGTVFILLKAI